jgi:hypothetical protein
LIWEIPAKSKEAEMKCKCKMAVAFLLVLVMLVPLSLSCGGEKEGVTIRIGEHTDLTGPGSPAVVGLHYVLQDLVRYYNEEGLIPGVKLAVDSWDGKYDPSRDISGYDWLRGRGAKLIVSVIPHTGVDLKPFADRDKFPVCNLSTLKAMLEPPGWVFCLSNPNDWEMKTLLKWISENHWDYARGIPKVGFIGWSEPNGIDVEKGMDEYCQAHPDKFEWVGGSLPPMGVMAFSGDVNKLKGCDYLCAYGFPTGTIIGKYLDQGYRATFIDVGTATNYRGFLVDQLGYERLDGMLVGNVSLGWNDQTPIVNLAKQLLNRYRSGQAERIMYEGFVYAGGLQNLISVFQILQQAIEKVGAQNFDSQDFYDAAIHYETGGSLFEGYPQWSFSEAKRYLVDHVAISEFSAEAGNFVWNGAWVPLLLE